MSQTKLVNSLKNSWLPAILNSYSIIFFQNNRLLATVLIVVTFFNFYAGLSGLLAILISVALAKSMHLDSDAIKKGIYSFNALLTGLGMGTFFDLGIVFFSLLIVVTIFCLLISVSLGGWLYKYNLPHLSIPFVISFWFLLLPASHFENLGLTQRNIYWLNEMYAMGGTHLIAIFQSIDSLPLNKMVDIYFRSLSSVLFQSNLVSGILIAVALLISSRIMFSLSIIGFLSAYLFAQFTGSETASLTYYNIGANYMMVAFAVGGFFTIPSGKSYLWTVLLVPVTSLILLFFYKLLGYIQLPEFSLPFSFVVILFIYFLQQRTKAGGLVLTPYQNYSPEVNLYTYKNNSERFSRFMYKTLSLPFWGEWTVTQGYDGQYTHLGEWGKALDFMIKDSNGSTHRSQGFIVEEYYCFNKPVIAAGDGIVEVAVDNIEDNEPGKINTMNNWGNTVIINHYNGIYSQVSHLKNSSIKVKKGDFVKAGDIIALCGNSGRSPEPHLHFQIQSQPVVGSKTKIYPVSYFYSKVNDHIELRQFSVPKENEVVSNINPERMLIKAFDILPENNLKFTYKSPKGIQMTEDWNSYTDAYNNKYLHCPQTGDVAYYICDGSMFYFTTYYGSKKSLLHSFFLSAYKVFLSSDEKTNTVDRIPLNYVSNNRLLIWINDFVSPFKNLVSVKFRLHAEDVHTNSDTETVVLKSETALTYPGRKIKMVQSLITIKNGGIQKIEFNSGKTNIHATCIN